MALFVQSIDIHGSPAVAAPNAHEIDALCDLLTHDVLTHAKVNDLHKDNKMECATHLRRAITESLEQNDPEMLFKLGTCYEFGLHGLPVDRAKSMPYYELAASLDHLPSLNALASLYADLFDQTKLETYHQQAHKFFALASKLGSLDAAYNLGCLAASQGNQASALSWWHQSALKLHPLSLSSLCDYYWASKNYAELIPLLITSSRLGDECASIVLANCYVQGFGFKKKDIDQAVALLIPLAKHGTTRDIIITASSNLAHIYMAQTNFSSAILYYGIAAKHDHLPASKALATVLARMKTVAEREVEQKAVHDQKVAALLGERKTFGMKCSSCKQYGFVEEKTWIYCKCQLTHACSIKCRDVLVSSTHALLDCRKQLKKKKKKKN